MTDQFRITGDESAVTIGDRFGKTVNIDASDLGPLIDGLKEFARQEGIAPYGAIRVAAAGDLDDFISHIVSVFGETIRYHVTASDREKLAKLMREALEQRMGAAPRPEAGSL